MTPSTSTIDSTPIAKLISLILVLINSYLVPLVFALAFIFFLYGIFTYFIRGGANDEAKKKGKSLITWSMIGFFVMFSVWGIVNLLVNSFGFQGQARPDLPLFSPSNTSTTAK